MKEILIADTTSGIFPGIRRSGNEVYNLSRTTSLKYTHGYESSNMQVRLLFCEKVNAAPIPAVQFRRVLEHTYLWSHQRKNS